MINQRQVLQRIPAALLIVGYSLTFARAVHAGVCQLGFDDSSFLSGSTKVEFLTGKPGYRNLPAPPPVQPSPVDQKVGNDFDVEMPPEMIPCGREAEFDYIRANLPQILRSTELRETLSKRRINSMALVYSIIKAESELDKEALSRAGAVGLMQLMPETADGVIHRHIGLFAPEIQALYSPFIAKPKRSKYMTKAQREDYERRAQGYEERIEAVKKYLKFYWPNLTTGCAYFNEIFLHYSDPEEAIRQTAASYNLGPAKVRRGAKWPAETRDYTKKVLGFYRQIIEYNRIQIDNRRRT